MTHLRWNGVGDLCESSVTAINWMIGNRPDIPMWIVTRIPKHAASINHGENAYIHFSLDRYSMDRRAEFLSLEPKSKNFFFSYQCEANEIAPVGAHIGVSVIFYKRYKPTAVADLSDPAVCPLNLLEDCTGACIACRRCFNGVAVQMRDSVSGV